MTGRARFGVALPASQRRLSEALEAATIAEEAGADLVTVSDHPYLPGELDAFPLLSLLLARTERVLVAPNVTPLALRPPAMLAKSASTLQQAGAGRFVLGIGVGGPYERIPAFGGAWPTVGEAISALDEAIPLIRRLWGPAPVDHDGRYFRLKQASAGPPPEPPVPVWVGSFKPRMLAITGRHADGWLPTNAYLDLADVPDMQRRIDDAAGAAGREPDEIGRVFNVMGTISDSAPRRNDQLLVGPAEHWAHALRDYRDRLGFDSFVFWPVQGDSREQIRLFFEQVRPQLD
ncbi:alkanesulfonate monooxygenase SsuD/methylene tetrahydromethanopterin reductase-like flavin-dependent oxidoreductase (luciferase family) [Haloactinopolyspora alba]|uniref:Alkanesulfonate monooxygenase SsuD/methylene tetrahydromethanopterin reductase-like flavin-dependent oxidoreductase (Luciferase family) n=1 Tax=Haloactinopolyspora alba TaxID=648780 RepID=A0A2P8E5A4_9ACTN|nr:LLM class flavin-dependent oxidoreductase [Haloactinopolyspora alba]PSL04645.1 alkanesulfonate monooxygenase SsuD/methylene tetrahydromethanopterin reductase-like flavin-dependent oxidoreductase (luciferase family) [Haloactinopolyspora alba]